MFSYNSCISSVRFVWFLTDVMYAIIGSISSLQFKFSLILDSSIGKILVTV